MNAALLAVLILLGALAGLPVGVLILGLLVPDLLHDRPTDADDLASWPSDILAARPEGCVCVVPPSGPDDAAITRPDCPVHPEIRARKGEAL